MAKQEVLDAINASIAPNGIKGITAESLNNVLTLMAENTGSGSGDGAIKIMVPVDIMGSSDIVDFTPEYWAETAAMLDTELPGISDLLNPIIEEIFQHNAEVYQQLIEKGANLEGVMCLLDMSKMAKAFYEALIPLYGVEVTLNGLSASCPAQAAIVDADPAEMAEELFGASGISIVPIENPNSEFLSYIYSVQLRADGTMLIEYYDSDSQYIYIPEDGATLTQDRKDNNAKHYDKYNNSNITIYISTSGGGTIAGYANILARSSSYIYYLDYSSSSSLKLNRAELLSDGDVTVTTITTFNIA